MKSTEYAGARHRGGCSNSARVRSNTAASANSAIVQVNRRLLKNTSPKPNWFFTKDCAGSIHGRTCCNTCCANRLANGLLYVRNARGELRCLDLGRTP
jgi:hypothetical protein